MGRASACGGLQSALLLSLFLTGCGEGPARPPGLATVYAGPATLPLRADIPLQSKTVATVKHGEALEVIQQRRTFVLLRTQSGVEGWNHQRNLLTAAEMGRLAALEEIAAKLPSQGAATTLDLLNVHTEAHRASPSFLQLKEGDKVDVLAHLSAERTDRPLKSLIPPRPKAPKKVKKKKEPKVPPPPMPSAPGLPGNWRELSQTPPEIVAERQPPPAPPPVPREDWTLVRNAAGQSGWVLARRLYMAIPDEVAQYAEGRRITSYFSLGDKHWLWTTISESNLPYQYDGFRVFVWSTRRNRYETAYIERNVRGYFPTVARPGAFSVCIERKDGRRAMRHFEFNGVTVRAAGEGECLPMPDLAALESGTRGAAPANTPVQPGWFDRFKKRIGF